jgi:hypothetical protein
VQQDGRQEEHRRIQVEDGSHERDDEKRDREDRSRTDRQTREQGARGAKQSILLGNDPDEQAAGDQYEGRPDLRGGVSEGG